MRRLSYVLLAILFITPAAFAQSTGDDHFNVGVFGNFVRIGDSGVSLGGLGARVSVNVMPRIQVEAESSYNFAESFFAGYTDYNGTVTRSYSQVRVLDGLIGPKLYADVGRFRFFGTVKGGFMNINLGNAPTPTFSTVATTYQNLTGTNTYGVFYPGGGAEAFMGHWGLRVDVGDEIFYNEHGYNNLKVSFGPTFRF